MEEMEKTGLQDDVWQGFAVVCDDRARGVIGYGRPVRLIVTVRIVTSRDDMIADWTRIRHENFDNERCIGRKRYYGGDISGKPSG